MVKSNNLNKAKNKRVYKVVNDDLRWELIRRVT